MMDQIHALKMVLEQLGCPGKKKKILVQTLHLKLTQMDHDLKQSAGLLEDNRKPRGLCIITLRYHTKNIVHEGN